MKETIGEKIKRLRKEMGLTQENVHNNQSQISQIESGRITNPDENTLLLIAKNMQMTFDALIDETTWVKPESILKNKEIAFSPVIVDIEIDDIGNINWSHKSYPLYNEKDEKNEYCPQSGKKLIDKCGKCERQVENVKQEYCFGCGEALFPHYNVLTALYQYLLPDVLNVYEMCDDAIWHIGKNIIDKYRLALLDLNEEGDAVSLDKRSIYPKEDFDQIFFTIQIAEAILKKLKSIIKSLKPPKAFDSIDELKTELFRKVAFRIINMLDPAYNKLGETVGLESVENPSFELLTDLLNDLSNTEDSDKLIDKLQSKIDPKYKETEDDNDDEKILEDGNSETAAAEKADRNNKNAENKKDKEFKNE